MFFSNLHLSILVLFSILNSVQASPISSQNITTLGSSKAFLFRVTAYTDIINHIRQDRGIPRTAAMSVAAKSAQAVWILLLTLGLMAVLWIASLVTAATLSVLAFNKIYLRVIADSGADKEREYAKKVLKLRERPYSMICAFVFTGSAMAELIPLLISLILQEADQGRLEGQFNGLSIGIAVGLMIVFVELIPLGYTVRKALFVNKFLIRFAEILLIFWWPITFPINWIFDKLYRWNVKSKQAKGKNERFSNNEERFFRNEELARFVELHTRSDNPDEGGDVHKSVVEIMHGAFRLQSMSIRDAMLAWKNLRFQSEIIEMEDKVSVQDGLYLARSRIEGAFVLETEDPSDPDRTVDIDMIPLKGTKLIGFVRWTSFLTEIHDEECRVKFLSREHVPVVHDCFEDLHELFLLLHHKKSVLALVVTAAPKSNLPQAYIPYCHDFDPSKTKVFWSNQKHIFAYVKPVGVITYKALLKILFKNLSPSSLMPADPMDRFRPRRLSTQEKLALIDSKSSLNTTEAKDVGKEGMATGMLSRFMSMGTRRRKPTVVDAAKSPVRSARGSLFESLVGADTNENEKKL